MTNTEIVKEKRHQYLTGKLSHDDYYLWLADLVGVTLSDLPVPLNQIRASTDRHLNDIPLRHWDSRDPIVRHKAYAKGLPWSLSDTGCCLKAVARRAAQKSGV